MKQEYIQEIRDYVTIYNKLDDQLNSLNKSDLETAKILLKRLII